MRTSNDFFENPSTLDNLIDQTPERPTIPFSANSINTKPKLPPVPQVHYPIFTPPPAQPVQATAFEQIQMAIQKEVADLQQKKPGLDQLIQNALKQKIQRDHQVAKTVITMKKSAPPPLINKVAQKMAAQIPLEVKEKPKQGRELWWPDQRAVITEKLKKKATPPPGLSHPAVRVVNLPATPVQNNYSTRAAKTLIKTPRAVVTNAFHVSTNVLNYFLFGISWESDPYQDPKRQRIIYGIKIMAYLTAFVGIFELMRNVGGGISFNGFFEVISIFIISTIFFFFGENLSILFKPNNPYQIHEVV